MIPVDCRDLPYDVSVLVLFGHYFSVYRLIFDKISVDKRVPCSVGLSGKPFNIFLKALALISFLITVKKECIVLDPGDILISDYTCGVRSVGDHKSNAVCEGLSCFPFIRQQSFRVAYYFRNIKLRRLAVCAYKKLCIGRSREIDIFSYLIERIGLSGLIVLVLLYKVSQLSVYDHRTYRLRRELVLIDRTFKDFLIKGILMTCLKDLHLAAGGPFVLDDSGRDKNAACPVVVVIKIHIDGVGRAASGIWHKSIRTCAVRLIVSAVYHEIEAYLLVGILRVYAVCESLLNKHFLRHQRHLVGIRIFDRLDRTELIRYGPVRIIDLRDLLVCDHEMRICKKRIRPGIGHLCLIFLKLDRIDIAVFISVFIRISVIKYPIV